MRGLILLASACFAMTLHPLKKLVRSDKVDLSKNPPPRLIIIGEQKCGTTTLFNTLSHHEDVCLNKNVDGDRSKKELGYFDSLDDMDGLLSRFPQYQMHFAECPASQLRTEATPNYLAKSHTPKNIKAIYQTYGQDVSKLRFIIALRDPVKRALSHYNHMVRKGHWQNGTELDDYVHERMNQFNEWEKISSPGELYQSNHSDMVIRGLYDHSIGRWFTEFDPSQFFIVSLKQITRDTPGVMDAVHDFVGLAPRHDKMYVANYHPEGYPDVPEGLKEFYEPHIKALFELKERFPGSFFDTPENPFSLDDSEN